MPKNMKLNLKQLVDLAFEKPTPGVINIKLLHAVLHILVEKLKFEKVAIEYTGDKYNHVKEQIEQSGDHQQLCREFALDKNECEAGSGAKEVSYDLVNSLIEANAIAQSKYSEAIVRLNNRICLIECSSEAMKAETHDLAQNMVTVEDHTNSIECNQEKLEIANMKMQRDLKLLVSERETKIKQLETVNEQLLNLSKIKSEIEEITSFETEKAESKEVDTLTSNRQFEKFNKDIQREILLLHERLAEIEDRQKRYLEDLHKVSQMKLENEFLSKMRIEFDDKIQNLKEQIGILATQTSTALPHDANCLVCFKKATIRTEEELTLRVNLNPLPEKPANVYLDKASGDNNAVNITEPESGTMMMAEEPHFIQGTNGVFYRSSEN